MEVSSSGMSQSNFIYLAKQTLVGLVSGGLGGLYIEFLAFYRHTSPELAWLGVWWACVQGGL